ncbi:D-cysteine desulfhydrase family protein [Bacillus sp. BRMEA1]|uniref:D-cysteine desulfhydrase family protein n=1 Tax=Neobacillus endophyticus TaxID=2738405 RepID=UPI00156469B9|nr:D-cysteine desulfhydrase family protein [Neobacillus endophyticus]NRD78153.1 D-cysteine desulfhydrase family protein [Neobacillus endophyticus]
MERLHIANLPTPIQKLDRLSEELGVNIYLKRDDFTGTEVSGNKVRKLEFSVADALQQGCDTIITAGGIQSNHCRATAAVAAMLGLGCDLVIRGEIPNHFEGNLFLDQALGARVHLLAPDESREEKMDEIVENLKAQGHKPYVIPVGASNAVGSLGYASAIEEITRQENNLGLHFDSVVIAVGSGGTYAGLWYANQKQGAKRKIYGFAVDHNTEVFVETITNIMKEMYLNDGLEVPEEYHDILINDQYIGSGYAKSRAEELAFIMKIAREHGFLLDPVYTGKGFYGMVSEIQKGTFKNAKNILFIHTGGLQGWTQEQRENALKTL